MLPQEMQGESSDVSVDSESDREREFVPLDRHSNSVSITSTPVNCSGSAPDGVHFRVPLTAHSRTSSGPLSDQSVAPRPSTSSHSLSPSFVSLNAAILDPPISQPLDSYVEEYRRRERERKRQARSNETDAERIKRLHDMRELRRRRSLDPPADVDASRASAAARQAQFRQAELPDSRLARLANDAQRRARRGAIQVEPLFRAGFSYDATINYAAHQLLDIGTMDKICKFCRARKFVHESKGLCCSNGKVRLEPFSPPPEPYFTLFSGDYPASKEFLQNIRRYNCCFQMTSFGVTGRQFTDSFMPTFRIQGQVYHRIGSLLPFPDAQPVFMQIYFVGDAAAQIDRRCELIQGARPDIVRTLQELLDRHNSLIHKFRANLGYMTSDDHCIVIRGDKTPAGEHERRFNSPVEEEVAVIMVDGEHSRRDIILRRRNNQVQRIDETYPFYDALQYPIIFWSGAATYHFNLRQLDPITGRHTSKKISSMNFYAYHLMLRNDDPNFIFRCGQLLSQFVVDMYAKIESERLLFIRLNQKQLRVDQYAHLKDAIDLQGDSSECGQQVILPATFTGSPRHMHEYAQDAMAYVRKFGRPDLFITFTCNPKWPEIKELYMPNQSDTDRHDLKARVFRQKLLKLIEVLTKFQVFGPSNCHMYSIEWQKRGLPHAHILIWLESRIMPDAIDSVISAELPDPNLDPGLFKTVTCSMIHGPCGPLNPDSPCMNDKRQCTKRYPRAFVSQTHTGDDGYPTYRRRSPEEGGYTHIIESGRLRGIPIDNRWIVPYCPLLSKMFDAHINVEYCNSVKSIKYICKYVNKGSDMAVFEVGANNTRDEISQYQLGRYISTSEAFWRIYSFPIHERAPPVFHLSVHLENGQRVYFTDANAEAVAANPPRTTLIAFFELCSRDDFAKTLLYHEVPTHYTWKERTKTFERRLRGNSISRVYSVSPRQDECFFLRILLHHVRGPKSFQDLRTVGDHVCATYREACQLRGLLESDSHWASCLQEAASARMPFQLRSLFAIILTSCNPSNPKRLWLDFRQPLSEDFLSEQRRRNPSLELDFTQDIFNLALIKIEDNCFAMAGKLLVELGLDAPDRSISDPYDSEILRETSYNRLQLEQFVSINRPKLVPDQMHAFNTIMNAIEHERGGIFFLDAPGGTGKTFLIELILAEVRQHGKIIIGVASSGIAATLLSGGRTAHSAFKLPLDLNRSESPQCAITLQSARGKLLKECKAIIWDECTMAHKKSLEALDRSLRFLRRNDRIMGGVVVILSGDFRQTLPVIPRSTPADELNACIKQSFLWPSVEKIHLKTNMRVHLRGDPDAQSFADQLLMIGNGSYPSDPRTSMIRLLPNLCSLVPDKDTLIDRVFPNINGNIGNGQWLFERAILAPTNDMVDGLNLFIQDKIACSPSRIYLSVDRVTDEEQSVHYPIEFLNSLSPAGFPPHELSLKIGSPIMLLRNLEPPKLCNGTRLRVKNMHNNLIEATILSGAFANEVVFIPRIPLITSDLIFEFKRLQFPIKLAYAMTINKSQGQSLKVAGLMLDRPCFSHGQLYVACSRVGSSRSLFALAPNGETKNVVYQTALQ